MGLADKAETKKIWGEKKGITCGVCVLYTERREVRGTGVIERARAIYRRKLGRHAWGTTLTV